MFFGIYKKIVSVIMSAILFIGGLFPGFGGIVKAEIAYDFTNDVSYSASGTVSLTGNCDGEYKLFWGTDEGEKLSISNGSFEATYSEFTCVDVVDGKGEAEIYSFTAIPEGAETVLAYKGRVKAGSMVLPSGKRPKEEASLYSFGALSDLHFNRYNRSLSGDDAGITFPQALSFLNGFDVSLIGMSGDLSSNGEASAFQKFNTISSKYDFPVYTCTGNHDVSNKFELANWQKYVNAGVYGSNKPDGVLNVSDNGLDFVFGSAETHGDIFIFFSQIRWDYNKDTSRLVTDEQLDWLAEQLENYKDRTVFLFFHTFLSNANGDKDTGEGNLKNNVGATYNLVFTPGTADEIRFTALMKQYKNVVFFNGHSHWAYNMQKLNPILNITDYDGTYATMVHISSVSSPRRITANSPTKTEWNMFSSEGYLVRVYDDHIVLTGCDFFDGEMLAYSTFVIEK